MAFIAYRLERSKSPKVRSHAAEAGSKPWPTPRSSPAPSRANCFNTPVLLTCPLLESMPRHLWEIAAQALHVGGIPCMIEPLEHPSQVFVLDTQDVCWKPLIADFATNHLGQDGCGFLARQLIPGDFKA